MEHGLQGRVSQWQHGPGAICINRIVIKKRLLIEFSCEFPTRYPLKEIYSLYDHLSFVISGCHNNHDLASKKTERYRFLYIVQHCMTNKSSQTNQQSISVYSVNYFYFLSQLPNFTEFFSFLCPLLAVSCHFSTFIPATAGAPSRYSHEYKCYNSRLRLNFK